jgi:hypothetical protein
MARSLSFFSLGNFNKKTFRSNRYRRLIEPLKQPFNIQPRLATLTAGAQAQVEVGPVGPVPIPAEITRVVAPRAEQNPRLLVVIIAGAIRLGNQDLIVAVDVAGFA